MTKRSIDDIAKLIYEFLELNKQYCSLTSIRRAVGSDYYTITKVLKQMDDQFLVEIINTSNGKMFKLRRIEGNERL